MLLLIPNRGTTGAMKRIEVVAAVLVQKDKVLATQRGYGEHAGAWEFPGGKVEPGETQPQALVREMEEELGVQVDVQAFLHTVEWDYPGFHLTMHCYICRLLAGAPELREHADARWLGARELDTVPWLPADVELLPKVRALLE